LYSIALWALLIELSVPGPAQRAVRVQWSCYSQQPDVHR